MGSVLDFKLGLPEPGFPSLRGPHIKVSAMDSRGFSTSTGAALIAARLLLEASAPEAFVTPQATPQPVLDKNTPKAVSGRSLRGSQEPSSAGASASLAAVGLGAAALGARALMRPAAAKARSARLARELKVFRRQQAVKEKTVVVAKLDDVEEAEEIRRLQLEAAKLREDVLELEAVQQEEERRKREALFRSWDLDASGTLDEQELRIGLKEECKVEIDDDKAKRLLKALDDNGDGVLQNEEFCLNRVEKKLQEFRDEEMEAEAERRKIEALQREKELAEKEKEEYLASLPERNEDTSLPTRLLAASAYLLPLLDASRFGVQLCLLKPELLPLFSALMAPMSVINAIPYGLGFLTIFFGMQSIAGDKSNPALVRYNMRQAIQLDVMLFVPVLSGVIWDALQSYWQVQLDAITAVCAGAVFLTMLTLIVYSVGMTLLGQYPKGIPFASETAEMGLNDTRPSSPDPETGDSKKESQSP